MVGTPACALYHLIVSILPVWWAAAPVQRGSFPLILAFKTSIIYPNCRILNVFRVKRSMNITSLHIFRRPFFLLHYIYTRFPLLKNQNVSFCSGDTVRGITSIFHKEGWAGREPLMCLCYIALLRTQETREISVGVCAQWGSALMMKNASGRKIILFCCGTTMRRPLWWHNLIDQIMVCFEHSFHNKKCVNNQTNHVPQTREKFNQMTNTLCLQWWCIMCNPKNTHLYNI